MDGLKSCGWRLCLDWAAALLLAVVFGWAAILKLADPASFAGQIAGFELVPLLLVTPTAILLPGVELVAGLAVLVPRTRRSAALLLASLLSVFIVAALSVIARGLDVPCGCFGSGTRMVGWTLVAEDLAFLMVAGWLLRPLPQPLSPHEG